MVAALDRHAGRRNARETASSPSLGSAYTMSTAAIQRFLRGSRAPIRPNDSSREFVDEILGELAASRWSARGWAAFLARSSARSWQQVLEHPLAALEITVAHSLLFASRPRSWPLGSWALAVTHLGLLGDTRHGLGWANRLSLLRANLPAMVRPPSPWTAIAALTTDWADGWLARRGDDTAFGGYADALADVAFWTWYVGYHEPSRALRTVAYGRLARTGGRDHGGLLRRGQGRRDAPSHSGAQPLGGAAGARDLAYAAPLAPAVTVRRGGQQGFGRAL